MPVNKDGKTSWNYYAFPLASIVVPLNAVDESLISEDLVFTESRRSQAATSLVTQAIPRWSSSPVSRASSSTPCIYDRDKLASLGPGPHASPEYGQGARRYRSLRPHVR